MVTRYLQSKHADLTAKDNISQEIPQILENSLKKVWKIIVREGFLIPKTPLNVDLFILRNREKYSIKEYEINYRKAKLAKAEQTKKELEGKLEGIKSSIKNLQITENFSPSPKLSLVPSESRQEYYENERKKTEAAAKELRKYQKQQKNLEETIRKHLKKMEKQVKMQKEEEKYNAQYEVFLRNQRIKEEREKMMEKKKKRVEDQESLKKSQSQPSSYLVKKPLFQKFEEKFNTDILMPELERRKEELKKKREFFSPLQSEKLKEHNIWYDNVKKSNRKRFEDMMEIKQKDQKTRESVLETSWALKAIEEKRYFKEKQLKILQEKHQMLEKRNNYAELAQEMYNPMLDPKKDEKKSKNIEKKTEKQRKLRMAKSEEELEDLKNWKPKKFKPNTCLPVPKSPKVGKIVDYLAERRLLRNDPNHRSQENRKRDEFQNNFSSDDLKSLQKRAMKLEALARKKSLLINKTSDGVVGLSEREDMNELLIDSIKAKLQVLQKLD